MKITTKIFALTFVGLVSGVMSGQSLQQGTPVQFGRKVELLKQGLSPSGHIRCYTDENEAFLQAQYSNRPNAEQFEAWLAPKVAQIKADRAAGRNVQAVYNIPVVIHIVHNGDAVGTGENITDAQARSQINVMNQDYRRMVGTPGGANSTGLAVDVEINFCLAQTDPSSNGTTGIVRHNIAPYSGGEGWESRGDVEAMKAATIWNPDNYLNMWTVRFGGGMASILGYAQFPSNSGLAGFNDNEGSASTDGVVASFDAFGTLAESDGTFILNNSYNLGRTMTHEVGHWLGLRHIWGDTSTCPSTNSNLDKDFCADTPAANRPNYVCTSVVNSCTGTPGNDMVQNYMDYTYDNCMDTFTQDQKNRVIAVMQNSPRRGSLNVSTACLTPEPTIRFANPTGSINENSNCSYTDVIYPVVISRPATANAVVTFNVAAGGSATQGVDYQILNPSVTFPAGSDATQNLTVRVFHDGFVETAESFTVNLSLNANGGDAVLNASAASMAITIEDNDVASASTQVDTVYSTDFETTTGWTFLDGDGDGRNWSILNGYDGLGASPNTITGKCAYSAKDLSLISGGTGTANPNNFMISPQFTVPVGATAVNVNYIVGGAGSDNTTAAGSYAVYFTTNVSSAAAIYAGTLLQGSTTIARSVTLLKTHSLQGLAGQTGYIVFRHINNTSAKALLLIDAYSVTATVNTVVQTAVNTSNQYQVLVPGGGVVYTRDNVTGKVMADLTSDNFNYGCTSVAVSRDQATAGAATVAYNGNNVPANFVMAKRFTVTPANNNESGNVTLKFYFTEAEIAAWEAATGKSRTNLRVIKDGVAAPVAATIGSFGSNVTLTATLTNGLGGVYYFGSDTSLSASSFEVVNAVTVYPNPANDVLNINMAGEFGTSTNFTVYNSLGQVIKRMNVKSQNDLRVNTSAYSVGVYFIKIEKEGSVKTIQFIKK